MEPSPEAQQAEEHTARKAREILDGIRRLPAIPPTMTQILRTVQNPNANAYDLAEVVSLDPAVTATVLRVGNSSFYGQAGKVTDLPKAIVIIGFSEIAHLVMSIGVFNLAKKTAGSGLDPIRFWEHSLACALLAQQLARYNGQISITDAFMGGLLHDIGKLVFDQYAPAQYGQVLKESKDLGRPVRELEREAFEVNHAIVGAALGKRWSLPDQIQFVVAYHHTPTTAETIDSTQAMLVRVVHASDLFVRAMRLGMGGDARVEECSHRMFSLLRVSPHQLGRAIEKARSELERLKESLGLPPIPAPSVGAAKPLVLVADEEQNFTSMAYLTLQSDPALEPVLVQSWSQIVERIEEVERNEVKRRMVLVVDARRAAQDSLFVTSVLASDRFAGIPLVFVGKGQGSLRHPRMEAVLHKPYDPDHLVEVVHDQIP